MHLFTKNCFAVFGVEGLTERMSAIQAYVQPVFQDAAVITQQQILQKGHGELPIHIAKHLRRTVYAPEQTWVAIGGNARGYKRFPHFQITIDKTAVFIGLALIDQPDFKPEMADQLIKRRDVIETLPPGYVISEDHTQNTKRPIHDVDLVRILTRTRDVKKGEVMIGRKISAEDLRLADEVKWKAVIAQTITDILPLYEICTDVRRKQLAES